MRILSVVQVALLPLAAIACGDSTVGPEPEPAEFLLFLSTRDGAVDQLGRPMSDIYRINADGSGATRLTHDPALHYYHMSLSPDGRRVAFARVCEIRVMHAEGTGHATLAGGPEHGCNGMPRWSPDGRLLAFASNREGRRIGGYGGLYDVYVMNADGTGQRNVSPALSERLGTNVHVIGWSPAGEVVVHTDGPTAGGRNTWVYLIRPDGTGLRPLFDQANDHSPAWSPDGSRVAFISERDGRRRLYLMNADGTGVHPLTDHSGDDHLTTTYGGFTTVYAEISPWSPDGQRIAFTRFTAVPDWGTLHTVGANGTGLRRLTDFAVDFNGWSPRGTRIALTRRTFPGPPDVYLMDPDGAVLTNLTKSPATDTDAIWVGR